MPDTIIYPTSAELLEIEQSLLPRLEEGRVGLELFPIVTQDEDRVRWEQMDDFRGLQNVRGLNGAPGRVARVGSRGYEMIPGAYGDFQVIDEAELTRRRRLGTWGDPVDISDLIVTADKHLLQRELDRIEWINWTLMTTGTFSVANDLGVLHTDSFSILTFTASTAWSTTATSTPIADLRAIKLNQRGRSTYFGRQAKLYINQKKVNQLLSNSNANDLGGYIKPQSGDLQIRNLNQLNAMLIDQDLPQIIEYDQGYLNDAGTFVPYIGDNQGVLIGPRTSGAPVGEYRMTRNANNPDMAPGRYVKTIDRGEDTVPRTIEHHRGHNGGPCIFFPGSIVSLTI